MEKKKTMNEFVTACARGDLTEVIRLLDAGEEIDQFDETFFDIDQDDPEFGHAISKLFKDNALGRSYNTQSMTGLGAAMAFHRMDVVDELMRRGADASKGQKGTRDNIIPAVQIGVSFGFWQGVDKLVSDWDVPLWTDENRSADDLLFSALPSTSSIHSFGPDSNPDDIARARALDSARLTAGLETFDYLVDVHGLDIRATDALGRTLLTSASGSAGFWGDDYLVARHLVGQGCDPAQENVEGERKPMKIVFAKEAQDDLEELTGNDSFMDFFSEERTEERELYETSALMKACFAGNAALVDIYMRDERIDPSRADRNGHTAFDALEAGRKYAEGEDEVAAFDRISSQLCARMVRLGGPMMVPPSGGANGPN